MASFFKSAVPEKDRVPFWQKVAYGLGGTVEATAIWIPSDLLTPVFNIGLGMNPAVLGFILTFWRLWDAVCDQVTGNLSDNTRTRWGRRKPFIVAGAVLTGLVLPAIWWTPRGMTDMEMAGWLVVAGMIFYTCYSVWAMPYYSLQLEMSPDYDERTNITAYRIYPQQILGMGKGWIIYLASLPLFSHLAGGRPDLVSGMRTISLFLGVITIVFGLLPGLFVRERYYQKEASRQPKQKLLPALKQTLSTRPFLLLVVISTTKILGFTMVSTLGFYVNAYYVCRGDVALAGKIQGVISLLLFAPNMISIPLCTRLVARYGKRMLLYLTVGSGVVGNLLIYVCYTPAHPWLQVIPALLIGPIGLGAWLIAPSMLADVVDYSELAQGLRREGSFTAVYFWMTKVSATITAGAGGLLLVASGFDIAHGAHQPEHVLNTLRLLYIWIPIAFMVICAVAIHYYDLTRARVTEIRAQLEARRGAV